MRKRDLLKKILLPLTYFITLVTSILLFINYLMNFNNQNTIIHLHVWFGLFFLIIISFKKKIKQ